MARPIYPRPRQRYTLRLEPSVVAWLDGEPGDLSSKVARAIEHYAIARKVAKEVLLRPATQENQQ